ncbi:hypothetical protein [Rhodopirellula europaea]|uniref:hypothetical protein n=2 Tax=Rhodopirellula TaxID=265488 RepID=UPI0030ED48FE|tara:strand:- start:759 stop:1385 length:627 start_codon:yes stop_codon:yes gene_type:complete
MMHPSTYCLVLWTAMTATTMAQAPDSLDNPFRSVAADDTVAESKLDVVDAESPEERMLTLVHTEALPRFDRAEIFTLSMPDPFADDAMKREAGKDAFPVRPYGKNATVLKHKTLTGPSCDDLRELWQELTFDRDGGAFCHRPVYGLRFYRGASLLFETTVCWECQNFYVPKFDRQKRTFSHRWHGFVNDAHAKALLTRLRSELPHPQL